MSVGIGHVIEEQVFQSFPKRGTALIAASARSTPAIAPEGESLTMFTGALIKTVSNGVAGEKRELSFRDIVDAVRARISGHYGSYGVAPEIHAPQQEEGDITFMPFFVNRAFVARPETKAEREGFEFAVADLDHPFQRTRIGAMETLEELLSSTRSTAFREEILKKLRIVQKTDDSQRVRTRCKEVLARWPEPSDEGSSEGAGGSGRPVAPPEAPGVDAPLTLFEPPAIDQPVTPPEPTVVDQFVTPPEPTDVERPITPPEPEVPLGVIRNGGTSERAKGKLQAQAPRSPSATMALFVSIALAITLLGTFFYLQSADQSNLKPQSAETSPSNVRSAEPSPSNVRPPEPTAPTQPAPTQLAPAEPVQNQAAPAQQAPQGPIKIDLVPMQNDWTKVCNKDQAANKDICYTTRDFSAQAGQEEPTLAMAVYDIKGDDTRIIRLLLPVGLMMRPGFRFAIDKGATLEGSFESCFPNGCFADAKVKGATIDQIKKGSILSVAVKNQANNEITFAIPVAGFGRAFDGPPIDPKVLEEQQKKLQEKLQKPAKKERNLGRSK